MADDYHLSSKVPATISQSHVSPSGYSSGNYGEPVNASISLMTKAFRSLLTDGAAVDTRSEAGFSAAATFLMCIEDTATVLELSPADRSYRSSFTMNYGALFPDASRNYRVDILEASAHQTVTIVVNGDSFEFSAEVIELAQALQRRFEELCILLSVWQIEKPMRAELRNTLVALDNAWASFENKHINELIDIESRSKKLLVQAIAHERKLQDLEQRGQYKYHKQKKLVGSISALSSRVNVNRKRRSDFSAQVLWKALKTIEKCNKAEQRGQSSHFLSAAKLLSEDVVSSFNDARDYLRWISNRLEEVDPHLCNNPYLIESLDRLEECWETWTVYVHHEQPLHGLCDLLHVMRLAQQIMPDLKNLCQDSDVEFFLVFPRILWLRGLARPATYEGIFKSLLPHRFSSHRTKGDCEWSCDADLNAFMEDFHRVSHTLASSCGLAKVSQGYGLEVLIKRAVIGKATGGEDPYSSLSHRKRAHAQLEAETFMTKMESWSLELQRHKAEDWNRFTSIFLKCLL
eukprot:TRINITY_DN7465_c1_g1_i1.p1 TRINITY_DN7465_c1_g1~~TRINITY_DN7465_c1_g1_i1.p1  ORF type:complete len:518 (-),score=99.08 TRINITY_DN7465_c1_g1_i1:70-1623(-)